MTSRAPVWRPSATHIDRSRLARFCDASGVSSVRELDRLARTDPSWFWASAWSELGLTWRGPPRAVHSPTEDTPVGRWFDGGVVDLTDLLLGRWLRDGRGNQRALTWETEDGSTGRFTYEQLLGEVERIAAGLARVGVQPRDRVAIKLPMLGEAVVALLACARLGAISVPIFSGFGTGPVAERIRLSGAKVLICAAAYHRRGRTVDDLAAVRAIRDAMPTLEWTVVVGDNAQELDRSNGEMSWPSLRGASLPVEAFPGNDPLLIAFTSGTTGAPKGVVLTRAGFLIKASTDVAWLFDVGPGDIACWITDPGWIMSPIIAIGALAAGSALAVYDGAVDWPDAARLWRFASDHEVSMLGVSPSLVRGLMAANSSTRPSLSGALRVFASSGEPWTPDAFNWLFQRAGEGRLPIINYSGGTEVSGAIVSNTIIEPIHAGGFAGPVPGMGADVVDEHGETIVASVGELVLRSSSPGMAPTFWDDHPRYLETYWLRLNGVWVHGDWATATQEGVWYIHGRSDDTLKVAGKRVGPAEIEAAANDHPHVIESAAVGVPDARKGEVIVVCVRATPAVGPRELTDLPTQLLDHVTMLLGKPFRPASVLVVPVLPKTRSGKIMRRLIRAVLTGDEAMGDVSTLEDPTSLDALRQAVSVTGMPVGTDR